VLVIYIFTLLFLILFKFIWTIIIYYCENRQNFPLSQNYQNPVRFVKCKLNNRPPYALLMAADADRERRGLTSRVHAIPIRSSDHEPNSPLEVPLERSNPSNRSVPGETGRSKSRLDSDGESLPLSLQFRFNRSFP
jgi:hypothetical protein